MGGMNRNQMMAQARKMQEQLVAAQQQKAAATEVSASAGGGSVKVTATGDLRISSITIDPQAVDPEDVDMLQDMILAAVNDALEQAESATEKAMSAVTGGLNIPGLF
jgi:DNA-binding YbaB/EbfC family protein